MATKIDLSQLKLVGEYQYELDPSARPHMKVPARIFASEAILRDAAGDRSLEQLANVAWLPGIVGAALAMPDVHEGYGFPIGGVAGTLAEGGVVSPGGVGYDINCGVRLLASEVKASDVRDLLPRLTDSVAREVPAGVGRGGAVKLGAGRLEDVLLGGAQWAIEAGFGSPGDADRCEERGRMTSARAEAVSERAFSRGRDQVGTLGSGNHFIEIDRVAEVLDEEAARAFGLWQDQLVVQVHSGSRGLGHQVCTDYVRRLQGSAKKYDLPDRELVCAPVTSQEGQDYLAAMAAAANFAWANRQVLGALVERAMSDVAGAGSIKLRLVYDLAHNVAKIEEHQVNGVARKLCVHRKGAARAFPAGHGDVPEVYRAVGQPVIVPGDMGSASYVLRGLPAAMELSLGSSCHGAGRAMSRGAARAAVNGKQLARDLAERGIHVRAADAKSLAEEAPVAYKDIHDVVTIVEGAGLAKRVARLEPLGVIKG